MPVLGYIPKNKDIEISSRHLGLSLDKDYLVDEFMENIASIVEEHVDIDALLEIFKGAEVSPLCCSSFGEGRSNLNIAVARDEAFNFIYRENIASLEKLGNIHHFSPLSDTRLPECDLLYLPGGYPELHLEKLQGNFEIRREIRDYIENGGKALAECGGMMYLCSGIEDEQGEMFQMCGVLQQNATMKGKRLQMGYRSFQYAGVKLRGHEFHYSKVENVLQSAAQLYNAQGKEVTTPLYRYKNLIAGYTHLYWGEINLMELFKF